MDLKEYKCIICEAKLTKKDTRTTPSYACPNYKTSCPGFIYNPGEGYWKIPSDTSIGLMYDVRKKSGKYSCSCPSLQKNECKHRKRAKEYEEEYKENTEEISELERTFLDMKAKGFFSQYKDYNDYIGGKWKKTIWKNLHLEERERSKAKDTG